MTDQDPFEDRFAERLRAYAAPAARPPRPAAVASAVRSARTREGHVRGRMRWRGLGWSSTSVAAAAVLFVVAAVGLSVMTASRSGPGAPAATQAPAVVSNAGELELF